MSKTCHRRVGLGAIPLLFFLAIGVGPLPAMPQESPPLITAQQQVSFLGLETVLPSHWQQVDPSSPMRLMQFIVPGENQGQPAELIFYYFGAGQGGTPEANIARWRSQFQGMNGAPSTPDVKRFDVSDMPITRVKLQGSYARGIGAGPGGTGKPNQTLLAALLQTPRGQVTIQLHGETPLIHTLEPDFDRMLLGIAPASPR